MNKQIEVFAADGSGMTPTFPKRAKQLVKTGRADWVAEDAIRLCQDEKAEVIMDKSIAYNEQEPAMPEIERNDDEKDLTDEKIYALAKKRVKARSGLVIHAVAYIAVNMFLYMIDLKEGYEGWHLFVLGGWGIGLACHIASYFFSVTPDAIQKEYLKMKNKYYL